MVDLQVHEKFILGGYVEFNISGNERRYWHRAEGSFYLDESVFWIFADCFDKSIDKFNYYGPTKYMRDELLILREELGKRDSELNKINGFDDFIELMDIFVNGPVFLKLLRQDFALEKEFQAIMNNLQEVSQDILDIVIRCLREGRVLWILGV